MPADATLLAGYGCVQFLPFLGRIDWHSCSSLLNHYKCLPIITFIFSQFPGMHDFFTRLTLCPRPPPPSVHCCLSHRISRRRGRTYAHQELTRQIHCREGLKVSYDWRLFLPLSLRLLSPLRLKQLTQTNHSSILLPGSSRMRMPMPTRSILLF